MARDEQKSVPAPTTTYDSGLGPLNARVGRRLIHRLFILTWIKAHMRPGA